MDDLSRFFDGDPAERILVVGDIMLDCYQYGDIDRISPEAPVPVLRHANRASVLGGAANVAANLASLGTHSLLIGRIGDDDAGAMVEALCQENGIETACVTDAAVPTTRKTRFVSGGQQLLRLDEETVTSASPSTSAAIEQAFDAAVDRAAAIVLSDYAKGVLGGDLAARLIARAAEKGCPVIVDPKGRDMSRYRGATAITPNRKELADTAGTVLDGDEAVIEAARRIMADHALGAMLVTRSEDGLSWIDGDTALHIPADAREVFDVSGAGDTVVATFTLALARGLPPASAARLANTAAGIVVGKRGTARVTSSELRETLRQSGSLANSLAGRMRTAVPLDAAMDTVAAWRRQGLTVGFTNGCFDILHFGHASILERARALCDRLVVGLNSDPSVRRLKGETRPINPEADRAALLLALRSVDLVTVFDEDTPLGLIEALSPDILIKGADYTVDTVVGADTVIAKGGRVELLPLEDGRSTTAIVARANSRKT